MGPVLADWAHSRVKLLVGLLLLLGRVRTATGGFGLCFLLGSVALGVRLVLLRLALALQVVLAGDGTDNFFRLALNALDDAFDALCGATLVRHAFLPIAEYSASRSARLRSANRYGPESATTLFTSQSTIYALRSQGFPIA
ncbi:hypothetical protein AWC13_01865 [Mycobacterium kubicae]|nr:hypothetical protein A5725_23490 [Mycobacterium kubicae]ORW03510.1 hypothetical protein AWC13_01865 [Mycobacterium kubicae]